MANAPLFDIVRVLNTRQFGSGSMCKEIDQRTRFPVSMLSLEANFSWGGSQKGKKKFNTWWLMLQFFDIVRVLNTRKFGSGSALKPRVRFLLPRFPRRPASPGEEARENNYFQCLVASDPLFGFCKSTLDNHLLSSVFRIRIRMNRQSAFIWFS